MVNVSPGLFKVSLVTSDLQTLRSSHSTKSCSFDKGGVVHGHERKLQVESTIVRGGARGLAEE